MGWGPGAHTRHRLLHPLSALAARSPAPLLFLAALASQALEADVVEQAMGEATTQPAPPTPPLSSPSVASQALEADVVEQAMDEAITLHHAFVEDAVNRWAGRGWMWVGR